MNLENISEKWEPKERLDVIRQLAEAIGRKPQAARLISHAIILVAMAPATAPPKEVSLERERAQIIAAGNV